MPAPLEYTRQPPSSGTVRSCPVASASDTLVMELPEPYRTTLLLRFLAKASGTRYDEAATRDARRRIAAFFDVHLRPPTE